MNLGEARFAGETVRRSYNLRSRITVSNSNATRPGHGLPRNPGSLRPEAQRHGPEKAQKNIGWSTLEGASLSKRIPAKEKDNYLDKNVSSNRSTYLTKLYTVSIRNKKLYWWKGPLSLPQQQVWPRRSKTILQLCIWGLEHNLPFRAPSKRFGFKCFVKKTFTAASRRIPFKLRQKDLAFEAPSRRFTFESSVKKISLFSSVKSWLLKLLQDESFVKKICL